MVIAGRLIQGAAGATILACGLSLLSVANEGDAQLRAVSLWGAAAAVGAAAGPLLGRRARRRHRVAGAVLDRRRRGGALHAADRGDGERVEGPGPTEVDRLRGHGAHRADADAADPRRSPRAATGDGSRWPPWAASRSRSRPGYAFIAVEGRVAVPLLDLALLRNRVLVGSTIAILIGAGTINGLMYLLSLYFQDPATLDFSPLEAGLATLPATVGLVRGGPAGAAAGGEVRRPADDRRRVRPHHGRLRHRGLRRRLVEVRRVPAAAGRHRGRAWACPTVPRRRRRRPSVPENQVGGASGVSNMARYVGAAVATALAATIYGSVIGNQTADGASQADALASGLAAASWMMAVFSFLGVLMAFVIGRHRTATGTVNDAAAAAAAHIHTLPTSATAGRTGPEQG